MLLSVLVIGFVVAGVVNGLNAPKHKLEDAKIYHIGQDRCYYTQSCDHCEGALVEVDMDFVQILHAATISDQIILDENIELSNIVLDGYNTYNNKIVKQLNINLDLNQHSITSNLSDASTAKSLIDLQAYNCSINLNIKNGQLRANNLLYVFDFKNLISKNIVLNLDDVKCETVGEKSTPMFAHNTSSGMKINARNCEFVAEKSGLVETKNVGAFINSDSEFNFNNCYFSGGDGVYVKQGSVDLVGCCLENKNLGSQGTRVVAAETFLPVGRCLVAESYTYVKDLNTLTTQFNLVIDRCEFIATTSNMAILIDESGETGAFNSGSSIEIKSARFNSSDVTESLNRSFVSKSSEVVLVGDNVYQVGEAF